MFIMNSTGTELINADYVERFKIVEKDGDHLIYAIYRQDSKPCVIGRYGTTEDAGKALADMNAAICEGTANYQMPSGETPAAKPDRYHGKKPIRRGGS